MQQASAFDEYPFRGTFLVRNSHASVETERLLDHCVDAALKTARGLRATDDQIGEELLSALQFRKEVVGLSKPVMRVPPLLSTG